MLIACDVTVTLGIILECFIVETWRNYLHTHLYIQNTGAICVFFCKIVFADFFCTFFFFFETKTVIKTVSSDVGCVGQSDDNLIANLFNDDFTCALLCIAAKIG
jgi:hypothetical protein